MFSDASVHAYGAVAYLRVLDSGGNIHCSPNRQVTRLELCGAVCATNLGALVQEEL